MTVIIAIISFIAALGILVTIHEFGHFWVARLCGVKVLRFSVGFGAPLFKFNRKNDPTDYVIASIPLGGYVKMLDERDGDVTEDEKELAFNNKPLLSKIAIVLAGPLFNLIFAFILFWVILTVGEEGLKPIVGKLEPSGIASQSGIEVGDSFETINNRPASIWRVAIGLISSELLDDGQVTATVIKPDGRTNKVILRLRDGAMIEPNEMVASIGIEPFMPTMKPYIGEVIDGEPADKAGFKTGDLVISANHQLVDTWRQWVTVTRASPGVQLSVEVLRDEQVTQLLITPKEIIENDIVIGRIGVAPMIDEQFVETYYTSYSLAVLPAINEAFTQTMSYSVLTVKLIGRMLIGEASVKNLSGPISLAQYAGMTASIGLITFLKFLAFVSVSLGVINLLPIPMLDGGHLLFYFIEALKGKPVSEKSQAIFMRLGIFMLLSMMLLAIFVDLERFFG
ncbi:MAG: RIP metalloprotease RseP [Cycloclasticus sp.]|nr:MAG: RIP metalloprotease RseP [Cycloclasticus sp.]